MKKLNKRSRIETRERLLWVRKKDNLHIYSDYVNFPILLHWNYKANLKDKKIPIKYLETYGREQTLIPDDPVLESYDVFRLESEEEINKARLVSLL